MTQYLRYAGTVFDALSQEMLLRKAFQWFENNYFVASEAPHVQLLLHFSDLLHQGDSDSRFRSATWTLIPYIPFHLQLYHISSAWPIYSLMETSCRSACHTETHEK